MDLIRACKDKLLEAQILWISVDHDVISSCFVGQMLPARGTVSDFRHWHCFVPPGGAKGVLPALSAVDVAVLRQCDQAFVTPNNLRPFKDQQQR